MASVVPGFENDIFISYRQKDNKYDRWVTDFVANLRRELEATLKEQLSIYFDENPLDGILDTHQVDQTIFLKIKSLIFIPILSQTYCDTNCFAWKNEFQSFVRMASVDRYGRNLRLRNGNFSSRILCIRIHELDPEDIILVERELGDTLRCVDFIYKAPGVNRPLRGEEEAKSNINQSIYRDQINKVANAIKEMILGITKNTMEPPAGDAFVPLATWLPVAEKSIAVLPFLNMNKDPEQEYFADGITENILTQLAAIENLKVISRTSVMRYKNTLKSIREIASELNVGYVLEGSAQSYGEKVRINAQLIEAREDKHVWAKAFDRELKDIFEIQNNVASEVVEQLKLVIRPAEKAKFDQVPTQNQEAYDLYLKGRHNLNVYTLEGFKLAERYFKLALHEDPNFSLAYSGLARTYIQLVTWMGDLSPAEGLPLVDLYIQKVMKGDLSGSDYVTLGLTELLIKRNHGAAEGWYSKGMKAYPNDSDLLFMYSYLLNAVGRHEEGMELVRKAKILDPISVLAYNYTGVSYYLSGKMDDAHGNFAESIRMHPLSIRQYDHFAKVLLVQMKYPEVVETISRGMLLTTTRPPSTLAYLSVGYHHQGEEDKAKKLLQELIERSLRNEKGVNIYLSQYYAILNNVEESYHWLEKALETNDADLFWLKADPLFKSIQADTRFDKYLKRAGFSDGVTRA
jgi:TolB-like protein